MLPSGFTDRQHQLSAGAGGDAELHGRAGNPDHHLRRAEQQGDRDRSLQRDCHRVLQPSGGLLFGNPGKLFRSQRNSHFAHHRRLHASGDPAGQRQLCGSFAHHAELHHHRREPDDHLRAAGQLPVGNSCYAHRHGLFGAAGGLHCRDHGDLHGLRRDGYHGCHRHLHHSGIPAGQFDLLRRSAGDAGFHGYAGPSRYRIGPQRGLVQRGAAQPPRVSPRYSAPIFPKRPRRPPRRRFRPRSGG